MNKKINLYIMKFKVNDKVKMLDVECVIISINNNKAVIQNEGGTIVYDCSFDDLELIEEEQEEDPLSEYGKSIGIDKHKQELGNIKRMGWDLDKIQPQEECKHECREFLGGIYSGKCIRCGYEDKKELKLGDKCLVWGEEGSVKVERIFLFKIDGYYVTVISGRENDFIQHKYFPSVFWKYCEPLPKDVTKKEALEALKQVRSPWRPLGVNCSEKEQELFDKVKDYITNN